MKWNAARARTDLRILVVAAVALHACWAVAAASEFPGRAWRRWKSPAEAGWSVASLEQARQLSRQLDTAAVVVVHRGVVVDEWGATALPLRCHSVRKSLLSALYGMHVAAKTIDLDASMADLHIDDNPPSLSEVERQATLRDLLKARSGIYHAALYETASMAARRPPRGSHAPDTFWYYNNWDFNAAGTIFEKLVGKSVFEEFELRLARELQMQDFVRERHTAYVTGDDSIHPAYPFELSARDLARFGLLMCRQGKWNGKQLVPADWVRESTQSYSDAGSSGGYGYMWWVAVEGRHFGNVSVPEGTYSARGNRGQYVVIVPELDLVVVHRVNTFQPNTAVSSGDFGKLLALILAAAPQPQEPRQQNAPPARQAEYDLMIHGGEVIDGTGQPRRHADVAIRDGHIVAVGQLDPSAAEATIDATGLIVAPGFIDLHSHADKGLVADDPLRRSAPNLITQGITTVVVNQDGSGPQSIREQRQQMQRKGVGLNVVPLIGHGTVRGAVMGGDYRRAANSEQIARMQEQVRRGMEQGAFGLSAGLEYVPGRWSTVAEMTALVGELAPFDGAYIVHERSSGSRPMWYLPSRDEPDQPSMIDNLLELIEIGQATGVKVVATHIKARGVDFWGSSRAMIQLIEQAQADGVRLFADQYAYNTSGSDGRIVLLPDWLEKRVTAEIGSETGDADGHAKRSPAEWLEQALSVERLAADLRRDIEFEIARRGGGESIVVVDHPPPELMGKTLAELAREAQLNEVEMVIRLQCSGDRTRRGGCRLRAFSMSNDDVQLFAGRPWVATSSDAGIALPSDGPVHPRYYGAFPRKIRRYALDTNVLSLEEAVRVSTSLPAAVMNLADRGTLRPGAWADLVVFNADEIRDLADEFEPHRPAAGIEFVLVNGELAVDGGQPNGRLAGKVLRRSDDRQ